MTVKKSIAKRPSTLLEQEKMGVKKTTPKPPSTLLEQEKLAREKIAVKKTTPKRPSTQMNPKKVSPYRQIETRKKIVRRRRNTMWYNILENMYETTGEKLKDTDGRYNRQMMFTLIREFVTEKMCMDGELKKIGPEGKCVQKKLIDRYGAKQVLRWNKAKLGLERKIVHKVEKEIKLFTDDTDDFKKKMSYYPSDELFTDRAWRNQKESIMKNIIEPFLTRQEENEMAVKKVEQTRELPTTITSFGDTTESNEENEEPVMNSDENEEPVMNSDENEEPVMKRMKNSEENEEPVIKRMKNSEENEEPVMNSDENEETVKRMKRQLYE